MLLTTFSLWLLALYGLHGACFGDVLSRHLLAAPEALVRQADAALDSGMEHASPEAAAFVRGFVLRTALALAMLGLELVLLFRLLWMELLPWLALGVLTKDLLAGCFAWWISGHIGGSEALFGSLRALPPSILCLERASSLVSGLGALAFFLVLALQ